MGGRTAKLSGGRGVTAFPFARKCRQGHLKGGASMLISLEGHEGPKVVQVFFFFFIFLFFVIGTGYMSIAISRRVHCRNRKAICEAVLRSVGFFEAFQRSNRLMAHSPTPS